MSRCDCGKFKRERAMGSARAKKNVAGRAWAPRGFTLVELMVTVAVVAILAALAVPSYSSYVVRSKRAEAKTVILQAAQFMERNYTQAGCYNSQISCAPTPGAATVLPPTLSQSPTTGLANYTIALAATPQSFTLTAAPCGATSGTCAGFTDPDCGSLSLDNAGTKGASGASTAPAILQCWQR
jgi:type IV pilus assembly protein PilE